MQILPPALATLAGLTLSATLAAQIPTLSSTNSWVNPANGDVTVYMTSTFNEPGYGYGSVEVAADSLDGGGSLQTNGTSKSFGYLPYYNGIYGQNLGLFGRAIQVGDIANVRFTSKQPGAINKSWYVTLYTPPQAGQLASPGSSWYGARLQAYPLYASNVNFVADQWTEWSTDGAANRLRWYDINAGSLGGNNAYNDPFWADMLDRPTLRSPGLTYGDSYVMMIAVSSWDNAYLGQLDSVVFEMADGQVITVDFGADSDGDGLANGLEARLGSDPTLVDTDGDGLHDATERERGTGLLDTDSDDDGLTDGYEVDNNLNPLNADSDGDGFADGFEATQPGCDPADAAVPLNLSGNTVEEAMQDEAELVADVLIAVPLTAFYGSGNTVAATLDLAKNANAAKGRKNSLVTRIQNAGKQFAAGDFAGAVSTLDGVVGKLDGSSKDWMADGQAKTDLVTELNTLIALATFLSI
jgi:hypothetical protein